MKKEMSPPTTYHRNNRDGDVYIKMDYATPEQREMFDADTGNIVDPNTTDVLWEEFTKAMTEGKRITKEEYEKARP